MKLLFLKKKTTETDSLGLIEYKGSKTYKGNMIIDGSQVSSVSHLPLSDVLLNVGFRKNL